MQGELFIFLKNSFFQTTKCFSLNRKCQLNIFKSGDSWRKVKGLHFFKRKKKKEKMENKFWLKDYCHWTLNKYTQLHGSITAFKARKKRKHIMNSTWGCQSAQFMKSVT